MADKLRRLGVRDVHVQPLGVDLATFHPPGATHMYVPNWALPTPAAC